MGEIKNTEKKIQKQTHTYFVKPVREDKIFQEIVFKILHIHVRNKSHLSLTHTIYKT